MQQTATVIADSIGPNGKRITTVEVDHARFIHPELLRHRLFSFSVGSSRAIPYSKQRQQVADDPMLPVLWPKQHKGMQGTEVFDLGPETNLAIQEQWSDARTNALEVADFLSEQGLSKQLTNRLLEPWVSTKCVVTATEWDNFFLLRHPWFKEEMIGVSEYHTPSPTDGVVWEEEVNLEFPAEYNIQDLAIKIKSAMNASTPRELGEGEWHLPFINQEDIDYVEELGVVEDNNQPLIKVSAARCARTSYGKNMGKSFADDIVLANALKDSNHWSPFEHQAQAIPTDQMMSLESDPWNNPQWELMPEGCELRVDKNGKAVVWSRNFKGWTQARSLLDA